MGCICTRISQTNNKRSAEDSDLILLVLSVRQGLTEYLGMEETDKPVLEPATTEESTDKRCMVRTNQVAPIIIKNCREEYQTLVEFKEPIVMGCIADHFLEHPLIKGKYFVVKDTLAKDDVLQTIKKHHAPNFWRTKADFPVFACGQPTANGTVALFDSFLDRFKDVFVFNLREDPVLFLNCEDDFETYSIRHHNNVFETVFNTRDAKDANEMEARIRQDIVDLASIGDIKRFYFYDDLDNLHDEPHIKPVRHEDDLLVAEEVYSRQAFLKPSLTYQRLCFPVNGCPDENAVDCFLTKFKELDIFDTHIQCPAILSICQTGKERATVGMVMGCLLLACKQGFPSEISHHPHPINTEHPNFEQGEFQATQALVKALKGGLKIKQQVDIIIDKCSEMINLRTIISDTVKELHSATDRSASSREELRPKCCDYLERYLFLISYNAYLQDQFRRKLPITYSRWVHLHPEVTRISCALDFSEKACPLVLAPDRSLVADNYVGLDVLSSQMDVRVSNFRRLQGLPIFGMAQPARNGLSRVVSHLMVKKLGHSQVILINLRNDLTVECDDDTYCVHHTKHMEEPVLIGGASGKELEEKEELLKKEIKRIKTIEVYQELEHPAVSKTFSSVLTPYDLWEHQRLQTLDLYYHRMPFQCDSSLEEKEFDDLQQLLFSYYKSDSDWQKDNLAFVFHCRTGKSRTSQAMAVAALIFFHIRDFPYGSKPGEPERVSCPNAQYTKGEYIIVQKLVRLLPEGQQVKREVDLVLDILFETMSTTLFHLREVIFVTYNKIKNATSDKQKDMLQRLSMEYLERYIYLILYNSYLHCEKESGWERSFSQWMKQVAAPAGVYELLDSLGFYDFGPVSNAFMTRKERWKARQTVLSCGGNFI
ncbi:paladin-like isoform X2 [Gigantopelta aegis]|uniref:paladin-like isoform X2 n=1 Tax=Gigantopelta aegis TaxID=1735272 RepID=UPI001B887750|nr:paladin-like isoform X2 [Gigantopelta aegis]XP_041362866.1 paladin-like isoform X2 [Gigantopelta aegis]